MKTSNHLNNINTFIDCLTFDLSRNAITNRNIRIKEIIREIIPIHSFYIAYLHKLIYCYKVKVGNY